MFHDVPQPSITFQDVLVGSMTFYGFSARFQGSCKLTENRRITGKNMLGWSEGDLSTELQDLRDI
jgi:hypothetical protein